MAFSMGQMSTERIVAEAAADSTAQRRISIVDDDASIREALTSLMRAVRYNVDSFGSAEEFLASACCAAMPPAGAGCSLVWSTATCTASDVRRRRDPLKRRFESSGARRRIQHPIANRASQRIASVVLGGMTPEYDRL